MKAIIINVGRTYSVIHQYENFLKIIKNNFNNNVSEYFKKNLEKELFLPKLTICNIIGNFVLKLSNEDSYTILESDGEMCIMKTGNNGFEYITPKFKLNLLKEIFEYYDGED